MVVAVKWPKEILLSVEVKLKSKYLYKIELYLIKVIPIVISMVYLLSTVLSYFDMDWPVLSYLGGMSILPLLFLYVSSYVFRFCEYHRMFLHYISLNWILDVVDYNYGIPLSNRNLFLLYMIITGIFLFLILYMHQREVKKQRNLK